MLYFLPLRVFTVWFSAILEYFQYCTFRCGLAKTITAPHLIFAIKYAVQCTRCNLVSFELVYFSRCQGQLLVWGPPPCEREETCIQCILYFLQLGVFTVQFSAVLDYFQYCTFRCGLDKTITTPNLIFAITYAV